MCNKKINDLETLIKRLRDEIRRLKTENIKQKTFYKQTKLNKGSDNKDSTNNTHNNQNSTDLGHPQLNKDNNNSKTFGNSIGYSDALEIDEEIDKDNNDGNNEGNNRYNNYINSNGKINNNSNNKGINNSNNRYDNKNLHVKTNSTNPRIRNNYSMTANNRGKRSGSPLKNGMNNKGNMLNTKSVTVLPNINGNNTRLVGSASKPKLPQTFSNLSNSELEEPTIPFSQEELDVLLQFFGGDKQKYDNFMNKIKINDKAKKIWMNKYNKETKKLNGEIEGYKGQIESLSKMNKDTDLRLKILSLQLNEARTDKKILYRRLNDIEKKDKEIPGSKINNIDSLNNELDKTKKRMLRLLDRRAIEKYDKGQENPLKGILDNSANKEQVMGLMDKRVSKNKITDKNNNEVKKRNPNIKNKKQGENMIKSNEKHESTNKKIEEKQNNENQEAIKNANETDDKKEDILPQINNQQVNKNNFITEARNNLKQPLEEEEEEDDEEYEEEED